MSPREVLVQLDAQRDRLRELCTTKGMEYSNDRLDDLANFKRIAERIDSTPARVVWVLLEKHLDAIAHAVKTGEPITEPLQSRIDDACLYLLLLLCVSLDRTSGVACDAMAVMDYVGELVTVPCTRVDHDTVMIKLHGDGPIRMKIGQIYKNGKLVSIDEWAPV